MLCPLKIKITQFPKGFHLNTFFTSSVGRCRSKDGIHFLPIQQIRLSRALFYSSLFISNSFSCTEISTTSFFRYIPASQPCTEQYYLWLYFDGPLWLYVNIADSLSYVLMVLVDFWPVEQFDRALCSHGTVQYFCSSHWTVKSKYVQEKRVITRLVYPCSQYLFAIFLSFSSSVTPHPCSHTFAVQKFGRSRCSHLAVQIFDSAGQKLTSILAFKFLNG